VPTTDRSKVPSATPKRENPPPKKKKGITQKLISGKQVCNTSIHQAKVKCAFTYKQQSCLTPLLSKTSQITVVFLPAKLYETTEAYTYQCKERLTSEMSV